MKSISKSQVEEHTRLSGELNTAKEALEAAINLYNEKVADAFMGVEKARDELNTTIGTANEFRQGLADDMQSFYDEKSEKWQEGDSGTQYQTWMDTWNEELDEVDVDEPDTLEVPDTELETFENLPMNAGEV